MSFKIFAGTKTKSKKVVGGASFWSALGNLQNSTYAAKIAGDRLKRSISKDVAVRDAVSILKQAKANIVKYGATEAAMAIFNQGNQLGESIGISIPTVNSVNAAAVGKACCSKISRKISDTVKYAKHYGNTVVAHTAVLINKTHAAAESQKYILEMLYNKISNDIKVVNAKRFSKTAVCGYTRPIFMEHVDALQFIADNLHRCNNLSQCKKMFRNQFAILGWNVTDEGEITEATPEEISEQSPDEEEVMNPVVDPDSGDPIVEEDEPKLVEEPAVVNPEEDEEEVPAAAPQEQPMAVFGWNPSTIRQAAASLHKLAGCSSKFVKAYNNMLAAKRKLGSSVEAYSSALEKKPVLLTIDSCRKYNTFVGNLIYSYNQASGTLVNQVISMYGILKDAEVFPASSSAVNAKSITAKTPWGLKKSKSGFFNTDEILEGDDEGEEDASGTELPGDLGDETEGPTEAEDPVEAATDRYYDKKKKKAKKKRVIGLFTYDEDEIREGDAEGEEDVAGAALPGDLEDDTEGPTEAEEPTETDIWSTTLSNYFDEDELVTEETAEDGDAENAEEVVEEELAEEAEANASEDGDTPADGPDVETSDSEADEDEIVSSEESFHYFDDAETLAEGEEDESGTELPGELENETEGPTEAEEPIEEDGDMPADDTETPDSSDQGEIDDPVNEEASTVDLVDYFNNEELVIEDDSEDVEETTEEDTVSEEEDIVSDEEEDVTDFYSNKKKKKKVKSKKKRFTSLYGYDEDTLPEGDANGEEDASGTELPGDLEDDTEGPTEAQEPIDFWYNEDGDASDESDDDASEETDEDSESGDEEAGDTEAETSEGDEEVVVEETEADEEDETSDDNPMTNWWYLDENEDGDAPADPEEELVETIEEPVEEEVEEEEFEGTIIEPEETDGDAPADGDVNPNLDTQPDDNEYTAEPDDATELEEEESVTDPTDFWYNEDGDIVGPNTPDEFPTEPPETPDGVDPNGEVDIPDAQTEPYMQPESTPPDEVSSTTIEDRYNNYFE